MLTLTLQKARRAGLSGPRIVVCTLGRLGCSADAETRDSQMLDAGLEKKLVTDIKLKAVQAPGGTKAERDAVAKSDRWQPG